MFSINILTPTLSSSGLTAVLPFPGLADAYARRYVKANGTTPISVQTTVLARGNVALAVAAGSATQTTVYLGLLAALKTHDAAIYIPPKA